MLFLLIDCSVNLGGGGGGRLGRVFIWRAVFPSFLPTPIFTGMHDENGASIELDILLTIIER